MNVSGGTATMPITQAQPGQAQQPVARRQTPQTAPRKRPWYRKKRFMSTLR